MDLKLIQFIASKLTAYDAEHSGDVKPDGFYLDLASVAAKAYEEHEYRPRGKSDYLEGVGYYR